MDPELLRKAKIRYDHIFNGPGKQARGLTAGTPITKPEWYDEKLILHAQKLYKTYSFIMSRAAFYGLIYGITFPESYIPLVSTGNSGNISLLFDRYLSTVLHVKCWMESDMFDPSSNAYKSLKIVRGLHSQVCNQLEKEEARQCPMGSDDINNNANSDTSEDKDSILDGSKLLEPGKVPKCQELFQGVWFSQKDMCATQTAFVGLLASFPEHTGAQTWTDYDFEAFFHHWRCVGHCLGATDEFNLCSGTVAETKALCKRIYAENRSRVLSPPINEGNKMGEAILQAFGSAPAAMHRYGRVNFFDCDPDTVPLTTTRDKFQFAAYDFVFHKLAYYPVMLWLLARFMAGFFWFLSRNREGIKKFLAWRYPSDDYKFEPIGLCPMKTKINYKSFNDYGLHK